MIRIAALRAVLVIATLAVAGCASEPVRIVETEVQRVTLPPAPPPTEAEEKDWQPHFRDISKGGILIDTEKKRLTYWGPNAESYMEFPVAIARSPDLGRTGRTEVVRKRERPDWRPTPSMLARDPSLPEYVPPGPENPMGLHALYLGWTYYAIHGTNDPLSIGRASSSGCFRLFPEHVALLFDQVQTGTPVLVR